MSWTAYRIFLRLLTPVHIGAAKLGNLQTTRPYIHGKALWGGLTARLARDNPALNGDYAGVGRRVNEELAFRLAVEMDGEIEALKQRCPSFRQFDAALDVIRRHVT